MSNSRKKLQDMTAIQLTTELGNYYKKTNKELETIIAAPATEENLEQLKKFKKNIDALCKLINDKSFSPNKNTHPQDRFKNHPAYKKINKNIAKFENDLLEQQADKEYQELIKDEQKPETFSSPSATYDNVLLDETSEDEDTEQHDLEETSEDSTQDDPSYVYSGSSQESTVVENDDSSDFVEVARIADDELADIEIAAAPAAAPAAASTTAAPASDPDYFFALNKAQFSERHNKIKNLDNDFQNYRARVERTILQASSLSKNVTSKQAIEKLTANIKQQLLELKQYKGILEDLVRRYENIHTDQHTGKTRDESFRNLPELKLNKTLENTIIHIHSRIEVLNRYITDMNAAERLATNTEAARPEKSVFYSKLSESQVFNGPNYTENVRNATDAAHSFLEARQGIPAAANIAAGTAAGTAVDKFTEANHTCRFIGTEVVVNPNKPTTRTPVAFVQTTNTEKTYSKQTMYIAQDDLKELDKLPLLSGDKIEKIKEQMKFVAHAIETTLASITTNGPIVLDYWPKNLARAAAVYCDYMGYDLHPKKLLTDIKPAVLETLRTAFKNQVHDDTALKKHIDEAMARRDLKEEANPRQVPRPR